MRNLYKNTILVTGLLSLYSGLSQASTPEVSTCPTDFYQVPLHEKSSLCQVFAEELPASLTYHASASPKATQEFYVSDFGEPEAINKQKGRIVLRYKNDNKVIIISEDGHGSQVDMLIKEEQPSA